MLARRRTARLLCRSRRGGQALVEFLPAVMIFILVLSAGLAFFRIMRSATIRQEAARNLAFAKIDFAGTLTTVNVDASNTSRPRSVGLRIESGDVTAISGNNDQFIDYSTSCFYVHPEGSGMKSLPVDLRGGVRVDRPVQFSTYAVVCR